MSQLVQHAVSIPPGVVATQVMTFRGDGRIGPVNVRVSMIPQLSGATGKPLTIDPAVITWEESDTGASWSALGSSTTVKAEKNINLLPSKPIVRMKAYCSGGAGAMAKVDLQFTGRFASGGQIDVRVYGGKEGFTYAGDPSSDPTGAELGLATATAPGAWPGTTPPRS